MTEPQDQRETGGRCRQFAERALGWPLLCLRVLSGGYYTKVMFLPPLNSTRGASSPRIPPFARFVPKRIRAGIRSGEIVLRVAGMKLHADLLRLRYAKNRGPKNQAAEKDSRPELSTPGQGEQSTLSPKRKTCNYKHGPLT